MILRWEEDVEIIRVLVYVEKESFDVPTILTDVLDSGRRELPLVDLFILLRGNVPHTDRLQKGKIIELNESHRSGFDQKWLRV